MTLLQLTILGLTLIGCCALALICLWLATEVHTLRCTVAKHGQAMRGLLQVNEDLHSMVKVNNTLLKDAHERINGVHGAVRAAARADIAKGSNGFVR